MPIIQVEIIQFKLHHSHYYNGFFTAPNICDIGLIGIDEIIVLWYTPNDLKKYEINYNHKIMTSKRC